MVILLILPCGMYRQNYPVSPLKKYVYCSKIYIGKHFSRPSQKFSLSDLLYKSLTSNYNINPNPTINLGDDNVAAEGDALPDATASTTASTGRKRKCTSDVWEDMDKIFATENGV